MAKNKMAPLADEVPWSALLTPYDEAHFVVYLRLLDARAKGASDDEMVKIIVETDPDKKPEKAMQSMRSHLERARWMTEEGYRGLFDD
jgi:hypothetical protein